MTVFATKEDAVAFVEKMARRGDTSLFGMQVQYVICWVLANFLMPLGIFIPWVSRPRVVINKRYLKIPGPVVFVSNHRSNWDYIWICMNTFRYVRPVLKLKYFRNRLSAWFFANGGAKPMPQAPKEDEAFTQEERRSAVWIANATRKAFVARITAGGAGLIFPQGTRTPIDQEVGQLPRTLSGFFDFGETPVRLVFVGVTDDVVYVEEPVLRGSLPDDRVEFLAELSRRVQSALDEAKRW